MQRRPPAWPRLQHWIASVGILYLIAAQGLAGFVSLAAAVEYDRALSLAARTENKVFRAQVRPKWFPDGTRFWYRVQTGTNTHEWVVVDAAAGTRTVTNAPPQGDNEVRSRPESEAPDRSRRTGEETELTFVNQTPSDVELFWLNDAGERRSYGRVRPGTERTQHTFAGHVWLVTDPVGTRLATFVATETPGRAIVTGRTPEPAREEKTPPRDPGASPDGRWVALVRDSNVFLRATDGGTTRQLSRDGAPGDAYAGKIHWAPDSSAFVVARIRSGSDREVTVIESTPTDQVQPRIKTFRYLKPGDPLPKPRLAVFRPGDGSHAMVDDSLYSNPFTEDGDLDVEWAPDSREFRFNYNQRGHQRYRILAVTPDFPPINPQRTSNVKTPHRLTPRVVVDEESSTFIDWTNKTWRHWLDATGELLWMSEREGWAHLWLYDATTGRIKNQVTRGNWVVRQVLHVDPDQRQVWFMASGVRPEQDPYYLHLCRAGLDGSGFTVLTDGNGTHRVEFSPDRRWFIDTWSRVDLPPVTELRRSDDGSRILELERADASALLAAGWTMPEPWVAKGRDGQTDIFGILIKPSTFDPSKSYPVIEEIYAGPHGAFVPKEFGRLNRQHALAELGFIVVQIDGMGTNHRGKRFHDVCWKNLADSGLPDHIAWLKAAATSRPWMDLGRVGIYGGSAGGQSSLRALLDHPDFYRVAVSDCGCHDNRMDKIWWNEQWLGWPVDDSYVRSSNVADAPKLRGRLLLTVGELDTNVDPASTLQVAAALTRAEKEFELLILPGANHGAGEQPYASRRRMEFFVRHLLNGAGPGNP